jgi:hypothetical protein
MPALSRGVASCARDRAPTIAKMRSRIAQAENHSRISLPRFAQKSGFGERR